MSDMTIQQFCHLHRACKDGREWALANCASMQDAWNTIKLEWLLWIATRPGVLTDRELRLFAVWSARQVQHLMTDPRSVQAMDTAERFANGNATEEELSASWAAAQRAAGAAAGAASWAAARDASWTAAGAASWAAQDAAGAASWAAAQDAPWTAARLVMSLSAAGHAARDAAQDAQAEWLRNNTAPNFKEAKP